MASRARQSDRERDWDRTRPRLRAGRVRWLVRGLVLVLGLCVWAGSAQATRLASGLDRDRSRSDHIIAAWHDHGEAGLRRVVWKSVDAGDYWKDFLERHGKYEPSAPSIEAWARSFDDERLHLKTRSLKRRVRRFFRAYELDLSHDHDSEDEVDWEDEDSEDEEDEDFEDEHDYGSGKPPVVPEPSTGALLLGGLAILAAGRFLRR